MLTPHSEASSPDAFFRFGARSLCGYRSFVDELRDETGVDMEYRDNGLLLLASDADTLDSIRLRQEWQAREGFDTVLLSPEEVRRMEPALTLELSGALFCPSDHHVRPRLLIDALSASCVLRGVEIVEGTGVDEIVQNGGRVQGVLAGGRTLSAPVVIVAAGAWASGIRGMDPAIEMCPRKGQMLALAAPENLFDHVVRWGHRYVCAPHGWGTDSRINRRRLRVRGRCYCRGHRRVVGRCRADVGESKCLSGDRNLERAETGDTRQTAGHRTNGPRRAFLRPRTLSQRDSLRTPHG